MIRLIPTRHRRIPHALAVFGALLLTATLLAGAQRSAGQALTPVLAGQAAERVQPVSTAEESVPAPAVKNTRKKFRVTLFLFRR